MISDLIEICIHYSRKTDNEINLKRFREGLTEVNFSVSLSLTMTGELHREKRGGARFVTGEKIFPLDLCRILPRD